MKKRNYTETQIAFFEAGGASKPFSTKSTMYYFDHMPLLITPL